MIQVIIQNISKYFYAYANSGSKIAIVVFLFVCVYGIYTNKNNRNKSVCHILKQAVLSALLAMYIYLVIAITMLSRMEEYVSHVNLRLFSTFSDTFSDRIYMYENILLFLPLGILLFVLAKPFRKWWIVLGTGIICSLAIEFGQLFMHLGRFEVDDILTNTIGAVSGFFICKLLEVIYKRK
ncbi:MAG: VanZ family protein [Lachnospiraceae bacterium]|nr:VanZ family protein [Lachnospiraceae bacterium]